MRSKFENFDFLRDCQGYTVNKMLNGYIAYLKKKLKISINIVSLINEST